MTFFLQTPRIFILHHKEMEVYKTLNKNAIIIY